LLVSGADPNQPEESGTTPLMCAVAGKKIEVVKLIAEAGAKVNAVRFRGKAETALDFAEEWVKAGDITEYLRSIGGKCASELPPSQTTPPPEDSRGTYWQLKDDSVLEAMFDPWPPKPGPAKLIVEISTNGHDPTIPFSGSIEYRIAKTDENTETWLPMKRGRKDEENNVRFTEPVILTQGILYVQFKVQPKWENEASLLKDWRIEIR